MPDQIHMRHLLKTTCNLHFSIWGEVVFNFTLQEWSSTPEQEFHLDWKPEWTSSGMTSTGAKCHWSKKIHRSMGRWKLMNLFWNEIKCGIIWVVRKFCFTISLHPGVQTDNSNITLEVTLWWTIILSTCVWGGGGGLVAIIGALCYRTWVNSSQLWASWLVQLYLESNEQILSVPRHFIIFY